MDAGKQLCVYLNIRKFQQIYLFFLLQIDDEDILLKIVFFLYFWNKDNLTFILQLLKYISKTFDKLNEIWNVYQFPVFSIFFADT